MWRVGAARDMSHLMYVKINMFHGMQSCYQSAMRQNDTLTEADKLIQIAFI